LAQNVNACLNDQTSQLRLQVLSIASTFLFCLFVCSFLFLLPYPFMKLKNWKENEKSSRNRPVRGKFSDALCSYYILSSTNLLQRVECGCAEKTSRSLAHVPVRICIAKNKEVSTE